MNKEDKIELAQWAQSFESRLARLSRKVESASLSPANLRFASVDAEGGISFKDEHGNVIYKLGRGDSGMVEPEYFGGPDPERPEAPFVDYGGEVVKIQHSGLDENEDRGPADYLRTLIYLSQDAEFETGPNTYAGSFSEIDGTMTHRLPGGTWFIAVQWETRSHKVSELSEAVEVEVPPLVDEQDIQDALDESQARLDAAREEFERMNQERIDAIQDINEVVLPALEKTLTDAMTELEERVGDVDLSHLESALAELNETRLPALEATLAGKAESSELPVLEGRLTAAFGEGLDAAMTRAGEAEENAKAEARRLMEELARDGDNLVYNGSFEHGWDGWDVSAGEIVQDSDARTGDYVVRLGREAANDYPRTSAVATEKGRVYLVEYWAKRLPDGSDPQSLRIYFQVKRRDDSIAGGYAEVADGSTTYLMHAQDMPVGEWVKVSGLVEIDQDDAIEVRFAPHVFRTGERFHVDDIRAVDVTEAQAALVHADNMPKVLHGTGAPSGTAPDGSIWWQHQGSLQGAVTAQWNRVDGSWVSTPIDSKAIANLDVGKLTAGGAVISDAVIRDLTASNGAFDRLDAREGWIGGVALEDGAVTARAVDVEEVFANTAVVNEVYANAVRAKLLEAEEALIGGTLLKDDTVTTRHLVAEAVKAANIDVQSLVADEAFVNTVWADVVRAGLLTAEEALIGGALLKDGIIDADKINAESVTAAVAQFLEIEAGMIKANAFEGGTFTGGTFQGSRFETHADPDRGVKMLPSGIVGYNPEGATSFELNAATGQAVMRSDSGGGALTELSGRGVEIITDWKPLPDPGLSDPFLNEARSWSMDGWSNWQMVNANGEAVFPDMRMFDVVLDVTVHSMDGLEVRGHARAAPENGSANRVAYWAFNEGPGGYRLRMDGGTGIERGLPYFAWIGLYGDVTIDWMQIEPKGGRVTQTLLSVAKDGIRAWDETGMETARFGGGGQNFLAGRLFTNTPGQPGIILDHDRGPDSAQGPGIWFSENGTLDSAQPAIWIKKDAGNYYTEMIIRGRRFSNGDRASTTVDGGLNVSGGRLKVSGGGIEAPGERISGNQLVTDDYVWTKDRLIVEGKGVFHKGASFYPPGDSSVALQVEGWIRNRGYWETSGTANVYMNSGWGTIGRISSRRAIKVNIKPASNDPAGILKLEPKSWVDLGELKQEMEEAGLDPADYISPDEGEGPKMDEAKVAEALGGLPKRTLGLIAEEVVAAGLMEYADWTQNRETGQYSATGVAYDRIWITLIPLVREHRDRIEALETENEALHSKADNLEARLAALEAKLND